VNENDQIARFRDWVPVGVTPRVEQLFRDGLRDEPDPERVMVSRHRHPLTRVRPSWRLGVAVAAVTVLVTGVVTAVRASDPAVLTVKLLADRASAAALTQPKVSPGQWVYRVRESSWDRADAPEGSPDTRTVTSAGWETADGVLRYGDPTMLGTSGPGFYDVMIPRYSQLGSLPRDPAALDAYLVHLDPAPDNKSLIPFSGINTMLSNYVLPPPLEAEMYQALAVIPGVQVDSHVTAIDGQSGVAFVLPATRQSDKQEIILDASSYRYLAHGTWNYGTFVEEAVVKTVIVGSLGSTQPSLTPPTPAELLAEQAAAANSFVGSNSPPPVLPSTWIKRNLVTSAGEHTVWATADDSKQASYAGGKLQVCSRAAACAKSTQWLMPAGPSYATLNPPFTRARPATTRPQLSTLPNVLRQMLATLNTYKTGCADVTGDCNAVNVIANILAGYASYSGRTEPDYFLILADVPGVTVKQVTDVAGQADAAFSFPFTGGITEILVNASTHRFAGYVRDGVETVITREAPVAGAGSSAPWVIHYK
jgi:hypothetical protein